MVPPNTVMALLLAHDNCAGGGHHNVIDSEIKCHVPYYGYR